MLDKWKLDEKKDFEDKLRLCRMNASVLNAMDDWVRVIDKDGNIIFMNEAMKEASDIEPMEYRCSFEEDLITDNAFIPRSVSLISLLTGKSYTSEIFFLGKEYSVISSPIMDTKGQQFAAVEVFRDISEEVKIRRQLFSTNKKLVDDIDFAKTIQSQLLPKKKSYNNITIDYYYQASERLSGDMFDTFRLDDDKVGFYICDVMGHGVSASLLTMFIKQNIARLVSEGYGDKPAQLLSTLKEMFAQMELDTSIYATIFYACYSKEDRKLYYANAGHNCPPVIIRKTGQLKTLELAGSPINGLFLDFNYKVKEICLGRGDRLVFYTDGCTEVINYKEEEFGEKRFMETLKGPGRIVDKLVEAISDFAWGDPQDDMAILVAEVN